MKTYSVKEISKLLGTSPETVRRWIRSGKLAAVQESRKDGNAISEDELTRFLKKTPKYAGIVATELIASASAIGLPLMLGGLIGTAVLESKETEKKIKNAQVSSNTFLIYLQEEISRHATLVHRKQEAILQIEQEIATESAQIDALKKTISIIESQMEEAKE